MAIMLACLEGDEIGPEITRATRDTLEAADSVFGCGLRFGDIDIGFKALELEGSIFPETAYRQICECDGITLGTVSHFDYPMRDQGGLNPSGELRRRLDLYANLRPTRTRMAIGGRCGEKFDLLIVRENTEGFYADRQAPWPLLRGYHSGSVPSTKSLKKIVMSERFALRSSDGSPGRLLP